MREIDFVPPWYRDLLRRRRAAAVQLGALALLVVLVGGGVVRGRLQVRAAGRELAAADAALAGTKADLEKLDTLKQLRDQWHRQEQVLTSTGVNVEASRLLSALTNVVPPDTALTGVNFAVTETDDVPAALPTTAPGDTATRTAATPIARAADGARGRRRLNVALRGVAPGELAVADVLAGLSKTPLFRHVTLSYAKDREEQDHTVREFEVTFVINLDPEATDERD